jgi:hypothetical protein
MFNSALCATQKVPPKSVQYSNDLWTKTEWPISTKNFVVNMLGRTDASPDFLRQVCFPKEETFHVGGVVNRQNCRNWSSQKPHVTCELERGSPKVNVWDSVMYDKVIGAFSFRKDCGRKLVLGHAGAVCAAPVSSSNYPPRKWGGTTFLPPC